VGQTADRHEPSWQRLGGWDGGDMYRRACVVYFAAWTITGGGLLDVATVWSAKKVH
jgi:hypothetical protein